MEYPSFFYNSANPEPPFVAPGADPIAQSPMLGWLRRQLGVAQEAGNQIASPEDRLPPLPALADRQAGTPSVAPFGMVPLPVPRPVASSAPIASQAQFDLAGLPPNALAQQQAPAPQQTPAAPQSPVPESSLWGRLGQGVADNSNLLLGLGSGLAGAPSWGQGISRAFQNAIPAGQLDARQNQLNATQNALVAKGLTQEQAKTISASPQLFAQLAPQIFGLAKGPPTPITLEENGVKRTVFYDGNAGKLITPQQLANGTLPPAPSQADLLSTNSEAEATGKERAKYLSEAVTQGSNSHGTLNSLAQIRGALDAAGPNLTTGPFAEIALKSKQAIKDATGIDLGGIPQSEVINKLGFQLATQLTKDISARPGQQEFVRALQNVPGLQSSPEGIRALLDLQGQLAQQKVDLGQMAARMPYKDFIEAEKKYYAEHPITSPFVTGATQAPQTSSAPGTASGIVNGMTWRIK